MEHQALVGSWQGNTLPMQTNNSCAHSRFTRQHTKMNGTVTGHAPTPAPVPFSTTVRKESRAMSEEDSRPEFSRLRCLPTPGSRKEPIPGIARCSRALLDIVSPRIERFPCQLSVAKRTEQTQEVRDINRTAVHHAGGPGKRKTRFQIQAIRRLRRRTLFRLGAQDLEIGQIQPKSRASQTRITQAALVVDRPIISSMNDKSRPW